MATAELNPYTTRHSILLSLSLVQNIIAGLDSDFSMFINKTYYKSYNSDKNLRLLYCCDMIELNEIKNKQNLLLHFIVLIGRLIVR